MTTRKILIIDDSELVLEMARDPLEAAGFTVFTATNGMEANKIIFSQNKPDLIVIDVMMPMLDGTEKAKLLKEWDFSRNIPILLMSSKPEDELQRLVVESKVNGYIHKPFTPTGIVAEVEKVLVFSS
ncbi:alkaline phosphatase synthesis transcriptional regulatory protein PhoP [Geobacter sp. OR-1]|uniref:response regulator n=1 Tax=Geobacter sp. OR-1 TaxID=1266765 RepID=UPI000544452F|nr:response regulator [Geobacter sp. OR-1]GAM09189.1 alkaline phosphatase synthesis transcriptional regulatory protein PhoP [Geobacter sp. OR-1]